MRRKIRGRGIRKNRKAAKNAKAKKDRQYSKSSFWREKGNPEHGVGEIFHDTVKTGTDDEREQPRTDEMMGMKESATMFQNPAKFPTAIFTDKAGVEGRLQSDIHIHSLARLIQSQLIAFILWHSSIANRCRSQTRWSASQEDANTEEASAAKGRSHFQRDSAMIASQS